jgi:hypothetical protein
MIGLLIAAYDFLEIYIFKQILTLNFTLTKPYNNNKIKITFTRCNARVFFLVIQKKVWETVTSVSLCSGQHGRRYHKYPSHLPHRPLCHCRRWQHPSFLSSFPELFFFFSLPLCLLSLNPVRGLSYPQSSVKGIARGGWLAALAPCGHQPVASEVAS